MNFGPQQTGAGQLLPQTSAGQVGGVGVNMQQAAQPAAPDTLLRALSQMEALNRRLGDLSLHVEEIAVAIGGPWPCDKEAPNGAPTPTTPPAMMLLNAHVDAAHRRVHAIEEAIAAIRRSLGA
jgi:hypothetical protein